MKGTFKMSEKNRGQFTEVIENERLAELTADVVELQHKTKCLQALA
jgi:hypothetical protein